LLFRRKKADGSRSGKAFQRRQNLRIIRLLPQLVNLRPGDFARPVDDEHRSVVDKRDLVLGGRKDFVSGCGFRIGPAVCPQREIQPAQLLLKSDVGKDRVR
jgi:hypothetical protein